MSYAIVGFGKIGQALAHAFARKDMDVTVASRRSPAELEASLGTATRSDLRHAASDGELDAGNVRTLIRGEECNCCRDFFGLASAAEWNL